MGLQMEMPFNLDPSKQAQEVLFSNKVVKTNHPNIIFNGNTVQKQNQRPIKSTLVYFWTKK